MTPEPSEINGGNIMTGLEILAVGGSWLTGAIALGSVILSWRKNGNAQAARDAIIDTKLKEVIDKLKDPDIGLQALSNKHTAAEVARTELSQRLLAAERDVKNIKADQSPKVRETRW